MITPYNLLRHELLGLKVLAKTPSKNFEGTLVCETSKTFKIKTCEGVCLVEKNKAMLEFVLPSGSVVEVAGKLLVAKPEDRIKKKHRIRY